MDQIAEKLRQEIDSLEGSIQLTEETAILRHLIQSILEPLERDGHQIPQAELNQVIEILQQARQQYNLDGELGDRLETLIDRHVNGSSERLRRADTTVKDPEADPFDFLDEDDEEEADDGFWGDENGHLEPISSPDPGDETSVDGQKSRSNSLLDSDQSSDEEADYDDFVEFGKDEEEEDGNHFADFGKDEEEEDGNHLAEFGKDEEEEDGNHFADFGKDEDEEHTPSRLGEEENGTDGNEEPSLSSRSSAAEALSTDPNDLFGGSKDKDDDDDDYGEEEEHGIQDGLFIASESSPESSGNPLDLEPVHHPQRTNTIGARAPDVASGSRGKVPQRSSAEEDSKIRDQHSIESELEQPAVDIFAAKISLKELLTRLDIQLPKQDITQLNHALKNKFQSKPLIALQNNPASKGQYVLIPRISRFIHKGQLYSCTVKNLARTYFSLFADIKDLTQFKGASFINAEAPKLGWTVVMPEAMRDSLDKTFMQQNQCLRQLATSINTPSHFVRRRSLPEAVYDLIVGRLVLDETFLTQTIDWTNSGPSNSEFVCTYFSEEGIRLRHLPRTQHNRALGVCPNW